jgi:hypothetical protein
MRRAKSGLVTSARRICNSGAISGPHLMQNVRLYTLATDFPRLWRDPNTPDRERKRLAHLLLQDVTLIKREQLLIHIRFPGGATRTLELPRPRQVTVTPRSVITDVDRLLDDHSPEAIANILNARGSVSGYGKPFTGRMINRVRLNMD